jgi:F-type H+-transporting ATPase subunit gamma
MSRKSLATKIRSVRKVGQVTKAMETVSAVKMRRSQQTALSARPYALHALGLLHRLVAQGSVREHALLRAKNPEGKVLVVVVSSDRGLAGAYNASVMRRAEQFLRSRGLSRDRVVVCAIGKRGHEHFSHRGYTMLPLIARWGEGIAFDDPASLAEHYIRDFTEGVYAEVVVVYNNFESVFVQTPVVRTLLPLSFATVEEVVKGIVPTRGKFGDLAFLPTETVSEYLYEPDAETVLDALLPYLVGVLLYHAVLEANASEHSARMMAMRTASDRARDTGHRLVRLFNKARQGAITAEISEIVGGMEAMK